jgi:hypothetical protein
MTWDEKIDAASKFVDVLMKAEIHSMALVGFGALMCLHGQKDTGMPLISAGCLAFKGRS